MSRQPSNAHCFRRFLFGSASLLCFVAAPSLAHAQYPAKPAVLKDGTAVRIEDYASLPYSSLRLEGPYPAPIDYRGQLGKSNMLVSEPAGAPHANARLFVVEQNGILYLLDRKKRVFKPYIDFGKIFARFNTDPNLGMGLVSMAFDPAYAKNGKFYTVHTENPKRTDPAGPSNAKMPALDLSAHKVTPPFNVPAGETRYESIVTEWRDTNINNATFEGTARELMRIGTSYARHPVGDLLFNPLAKPGDADYGNLYISTGDGEAGERAGPTHPVPQRLDALPGKILRITPDITLRPQDKLSSNGQYRIPSTGAERQSVRECGNSARRNLRLRPAQSAPHHVGCADQHADRRRHRRPLVGRDQRHRQGRQLRLGRARRAGTAFHRRSQRRQNRQPDRSAAGDAIATTRWSSRGSTSR